MTGNAAAVAEIAGKRHLITLDKGHRLVIRAIGGQELVVEGRPVTEFSAAVDHSGTLHIAAWLLSRNMMYYTSADAEVFTRSTLLKSDAVMRLKDCLISCGETVSVAYVAETEHADTLVCYRRSADDWDGVRVVEAEHPARLTALQFEGAPGGLGLLYGTKEQGRTVVVARTISSDLAPEVISTVTGGLTDFCALTAGGARQCCWIVDGHLVINGLKQTEEPWARSWPCLRREVGGVQCLWLEGDTVCGTAIGAQRARLKPAPGRDALPCVLALPGELRRAIVDARTLQEIVPGADLQERARGPQTMAGGRQEPVSHAAAGDVTLTDIVRNQAVYLTRMQESLSAVERNMLRMQAEVNRLNKEMSSVVRAKETLPRPEQPYRAFASNQPQGEVHAAQVEKPAAYESPEEQQSVSAKSVEGTAAQEGPTGCDGPYTGA